MIVEKLKDLKEKDLKTFSLLRVNNQLFAHLSSTKRVDKVSIAEKKLKDDLEFRDKLQLQRTGELLHSSKFNLLVEKVSNAEAWIRNGGVVGEKYAIEPKQFIELI